ncbi:MAG: T9SS type A sorting domain-containing protein [Paludibacteraceae bacterium]|nr:T9SS type A sorting domain-containing protein [Paludibacteraceae bacterium]
MRKNYTFALLIIFCSATFMHLSAQSPLLEIQKNDLSVVQFPLSSIRKLTFPENTINIQQTNGENQSIALTDISKMIFATVSGLKTQKATQHDILVYPNPATDYIQIKNKEMMPLSILHINGADILHMQAQPEFEININHFPKGIYIIKLGNNAAKFTKL